MNYNSQAFKKKRLTKAQLRMNGRNAFVMSIIGERDPEKDIPVKKHGCHDGTIYVGANPRYRPIYDIIGDSPVFRGWEEDVKGVPFIRITQKTHERVNYACINHS